MLQHCSCIDIQTHSFDFLLQFQACHRLSLKALIKFGILTAYVRSITIHFVFLQTRDFPNSLSVIFSPSVFFSLFVSLIFSTPPLCLCLIVCGNYAVGV